MVCQDYGFGISKRRLQGVTTFHTLQRGTLGFIAPEVLGLGPDEQSLSYTFAVDLWSLGAVTNRVLTNSAPFKGLAELIRYATERSEFPRAALQANNISDHGQDFVTTLMSRDPKARLSAGLAASHPWVASSVTEGTGSLDRGDRQNEMPGNETSGTLAGEDGTPHESSKMETGFDYLTITEASATWSSNPTTTVATQNISSSTLPRESTYRRAGSDESLHDPDAGRTSPITKSAAATSESRAAAVQSQATVKTKAGISPVAEGSPRSVTFTHERRYAGSDSEELSPETARPPRERWRARRVSPVQEPLTPDSQSGDTPGSPQQEKRWVWLGDSASPTREKERFLVVPPPREKEEKMPLKGMLKPPTPKFPEEHNPIREGVAPHKSDIKTTDIPQGARWTKISRTMVNPEALTIGKERFEVRDDSVIVLRVLSKDEIRAYASATAMLRGKSVVDSPRYL